MLPSDHTQFVRVGNQWTIPGKNFSMPVISGGDGSGEGEGGEGGKGSGEGEGGGEGGGKTRTFTQEEVSSISLRERKDGKAAGRKDLLKEFGVENEEEIKSILEAHRTAAEKEKSEAQKERDAAAKEKSEAAAEKLAAKQERFVARCERALLQADCPSETVEKVQRLLDLRAEDDPEQDDIKEAVEKLKKDMPQLFTKADGGNSNSDPGKPPAKGGAQKSPSEQAKEILAQRHPQTVKT